MESLRSLPFRAMVPDAFGREGSEVTVPVVGQGLLRADKGGLVVEIQPQHSGTVREVRISLADVSEVDFKASWVRTRLLLRPNRLDAFEGLTTRGGPFTLSISRRDRTLASSWATALSFALLDRAE